MTEWMIVYETPSETDAHIVAGRLQVAGIPAHVYRQPGAAALGITIGRLGTVTVLVNPDDFERARALLEAEYVDELPETTDDISYLGLDDEDDDDIDELTD